MYDNVNVLEAHMELLCRQGAKTRMITLLLWHPAFKSVFLHFHVLVFHSRHPWHDANLHISSTDPITTQLSAPAPIIILLATNATQLPLETLTPRPLQAVRNPGREKLAGSSNNNDQTAINQQRHISV